MPQMIVVWIVVIVAGVAYMFTSALEHKLSIDYDERFAKLFNQVYKMDERLKELEWRLERTNRMVIYTSCGPDGQPHIYPVPEGEDPRRVAEEHGLNTCVWDCADNDPAAKRAISKNMTGKLDSF